MRKTIFAKNRKLLKSRLHENMYNGWKQVSEIKFVGTRSKLIWKKKVILKDE